MQIFPRSLNLLPLVAAIGLLGAGGAVVAGFWYYGSPKFTQVGYQPVQPVPYSHRLHAGQLGIDCRYCHANVERSAEAMIPPVQTCMNCHTQVRTDSARLTPVREAWCAQIPAAQRSDSNCPGVPAARRAALTEANALPWVRVHRLPDHAYFPHAPHLAAGVGCVSCHGRVDQMDVVRQEQTLSMGWCLECHRNPTPNLRPTDQITNMDWQAQPGQQAQLAAAFASRNLVPPQHCSGCHR